MKVLNRALLAPVITAALLTLALPCLAQKVRLATSAGDIVVELEAEKAPKTVANFLQYVRAGHYDGTVFHRVIETFMIQGGGYKADLSEKPVRAPIALESRSGLSNLRGTLAMARTGDLIQRPRSFSSTLPTTRSWTSPIRVTATATRCLAKSLTAWKWSTRSKQCPRSRKACTRTCRSQP